MQAQSQPDQDPSPVQLDFLGCLLERASRILLVTHVAPDGDAIGSLLGLGGLLTLQGKDVVMACEDSVPEVYVWLPGSSQIVQRAPGRYDVVISLDCSDPRRMGDVGLDGASQVPLVNIDHHVTNTRFGVFNWVDPSRVATAQMVLHLASALNWELSPEVATCLLTGLVTDTRCFRTANVDDEALRAGLALIEHGASLSEITQRVLEQRPLASVRLWGEAMEQLHLEDGILWTQITSPMRKRWSLGEDADSGLTNFLSGVREAGIVVVFSERDGGSVDVGMRAKPGLDVAQVAQRLGGGGHPQAAGCTIEGTLSDAREMVLSELRTSLPAE